MIDNGQHRAGGPIARASGLVSWLAFVAITLVALNLYSVAFVGSEHTLYHADQVAYWEYSRGLAANMRAAPLAAAQEVAWSVAHRDLNLLPALPIAGSMLVLGDSRLTYLLSVINIYGLAVVVALLVAVVVGVGQEGSRPRTFAAITGASFALLLLPALWRPVFIGYLGLGGVALGVVIFTLYFRESQSGGRWEYLALIGFLVAMLALYRRWFAFWATGFGLMVVVDAAWGLMSVRRTGRGAIWQAGRNPLIILLSAAATIAFLAAPLVLQRFAPGYAQEFVAYGRGSGWVGRVGELVSEFGLLSLALVIASAVLLVREKETRRVAVLLPFHMVVTYLLMVRLQDHGPHHWYLYLAAGLLLIGLAARRGVTAIGPARTRWAVVTAGVAIGTVTTASVYAEWFRPVADALGPLVPHHRVRPLLRDDLAEVERLLAALDEVIDRRPGHVYVLGSSGTLSDQSLAFANRSLGTHFRSPNFILRSAHVDRRDGFPRMLLEAEYVVAADPPQFGMDPERQHVVGMPSRSFLDGENIAKAYQRLPVEFLFEGGVRVWVFQRVRPIDDAEIAGLSALLREAYPERPDIWMP